ncbi:hypothetical protein GCM10027089_33210 [Nocardia thraciensis]
MRTMLASSCDPWAQPATNATAAAAAKLPARKRRAWRRWRALVFRVESTSITGMRGRVHSRPDITTTTTPAAVEYDTE